MRLWSIHPKYLDVKGLSGLWRESLLAKKILKGETESHKNHPQLNRFKVLKKPLPAINSYLLYIYKESCDRGYCFNKKNISKPFRKSKLSIKKGQILYEFNLLKKRLKIRAKDKYKELLKIKRIEPNPLFKIIKGSTEDWEKVY
ncbi:hypothetical protein JW851_03960 [Candidatus Woesearchaeota archaeon]|nr:hypothetical protein [Candidatus Woesearchaeota archaeon]